MRPNIGRNAALLVFLVCACATPPPSVVGTLVAAAPTPEDERQAEPQAPGESSVLRPNGSTEATEDKDRAPLPATTVQPPETRDEAHTTDAAAPTAVAETQAEGTGPVVPPGTADTARIAPAGLAARMVERPRVPAPPEPALPRATKPTPVVEIPPPTTTAFTAAAEAAERPVPDAEALLEDDIVSAQLASLTLEEKVGQLFILDLYGKTGTPHRETNAEIAEVIRTIRPGGFVFFGDNIRTIDQVRSLISGLQALSRVPLIVAVDQEGGVVSRLGSSEELHATRLPAGRVVGLAANQDLAYLLGRAVGRELRSLGFTMNFAPVADVLANPFSVIGSRSYGADPELAAAMVHAVVRGIQDEDVSAVIKHFPGHGSTSQDSHSGAVVVSKSLDELRAVDLVPFRRGIAAGADGVMTAHILTPKATGDTLPATFSPIMIGDVLRTELEHERLIITDSLTMGAIRKGWTSAESALAAVRAGADILLRPADPGEAYRAVLGAVKSGSIPESRIDESVRRILSVKYHRRIAETCIVDGNAHAVLGRPDHVELVARIIELAEQNSR